MSPDAPDGQQDGTRTIGLLICTPVSFAMPFQNSSNFSAEGRLVEVQGSTASGSFVAEKVEFED